MANDTYHIILEKSILDFVLAPKPTRNRDIYTLRAKHHWTYSRIARKYRISRQRAQQIYENVKAKKFFTMKGGVENR